ncbi:L-cysteine desulfhydrase [Populus alba x Populus x berolinensis]|nr:L-cysteine desulfhydrase [Populus alba x Populus x berolinensis]
MPPLLLPLFYRTVHGVLTEGRFNKGDVAVMLHYAYGAVKKSVQAYVTRAGGEVIEKEEIVSEFRKALERGKENGKKKVRLAVIDHVTSMPSVVIPVKELVKICREEGVDQVFVDAAHGIGCVDVDVRDIGADFYTSREERRAMGVICIIQSCLKSIGHGFGCRECLDVD